MLGVKYRVEAHTFQCSNNAKDERVRNNRFNDGVIIQKNQGLHDVTEAMQIREAFEVFGNRDQRYQFGDVVIPDDKFGQRVSTILSHASHSRYMFDFRQIGEFWRR